MTRRRLALLALTLTLVAFGGGACSLRSFARQMIYPGSAVSFGPRDALERSKIGATLVDVVTEDGLRLQGAWLPPERKDAPVLLYFHGNGESAAENLPFAAAMKTLGYGVFLAEYRGYGGQPGEPTEEGIYADAVAAVRALENEGVDPSSVVLVGRSLGTGVATELAARGHGSALVLLTPYTSMVDMGRLIAGPMAALLVPDHYDNAAKIGQLTIPVVILHGTRDEVVPFSMGERLAAMTTPPARFVRIEGAGHQLGGIDVPAMMDAEIRQALRRRPRD